MTADLLRDLFATAGVERPEDALGFLLWRVAHRYQREVDRVVAPLGLTHLQFVVVVQTGWRSLTADSLTQGALVQFSKIHPMQLSIILKTLAAKGLVVRHPAPGAGRAKQVALTAAGIDLLAAALPRVKALQDSFFGDAPGFGADLQARLRHVVDSWGDEAGST